jgi:hypothetical protein
VQGELSAQKALLESLVQSQNESRAVLAEIAAKTDSLLSDDAEPLESESIEPVSIPPPLPADPTTAELEPPAPVKTKKFGMFHGW